MQKRVEKKVVIFFLTKIKFQNCVSNCVYVSRKKKKKNKIIDRELLYCVKNKNSFI